MNRINHACTYLYVKGKTAAENVLRKVRSTFNEAIKDESGMEVIAIILILVVVIALVVLLKTFVFKTADTAITTAEEGVSEIVETTATEAGTEAPV